MTRLVLKKKDNLYRKQYLKNEIYLFKYKIFKYSKLNKLILDKYFVKLPKKVSIIRIKNRCLINNCSKAIFTKYKLNRITLREKILTGNILGVKKASW